MAGRIQRPMMIRSFVGRCARCGNPIWHRDAFTSLLGPDLRYKFEHVLCERGLWTQAKPAWDNILKGQPGDPFNNER